MTHNKYQCFDKISVGGMAELYMGLSTNDTGFRRLCVIKKILPEHADNRLYVDLMRGEARLCQSFNHSNVIQVWGFEKFDSSHAIIMEYVNGADLGHLLRKCHKMGVGLSVPAACFIAAEIARGLSYIHNCKDELSGERLGIVHYDVSPSNILFSYEGDIKITDFGISMAKDTEQSTAPHFGGKPSYMSPEQLSRLNCDHRSDIYSLGIVLWEMIANRSLFSPDTPPQERHASSVHHVEKLGKALSDKDEDLRLILSKALEVDRDKRYESAEELATDLQKFIQKAYPDFTRGRLSKFLQMILRAEYEAKQTMVKAILDKSQRASIEEEKTQPLESQARNFRIAADSPGLELEQKSDTGSELVVILKTDKEKPKSDVQYQQGRDITYIEANDKTSTKHRPIAMSHAPQSIQQKTIHSHQPAKLGTKSPLRSHAPYRAEISSKSSKLWVALLLIAALGGLVAYKKPKLAAKIMDLIPIGQPSTGE